MATFKDIAAAAVRVQGVGISAVNDLVKVVHDGFSFRFAFSFINIPERRISGKKKRTGEPVPFFVISCRGRTFFPRRAGGGRCLPGA